MGEGVNVDGVRGVTPGLQLLGYFVCVRRGEHTDSPNIFEGVGKIIQKSRDSVRQANGRENAWAEERVAAEGVEQGIVGAWEVGVYPG